jgi:hypothetical protein
MGSVYSPGARRAIVTLLLLMLPSCATDPASIAQRQLSARVKSTFGIALPCKLGSCGSYLDGGSIGGTLIGADGDTLKWAWDGAMREFPNIPKAIRGDSRRVNAWADSIAWAMPRQIYVGATYFRSPKARALAMGSSAESLFISTLESCAGLDSSAVSPPSPMSPGRRAWSVLFFIKKSRASRAAPAQP